MAIPNEPITRREMYYSNMAGQNTPLPDPVTREEQYLKEIAENGGGGGTGDGDMKKSVYDSDNAVSSAGGIKAYVADKISGKVDKVEGKGLSENDYTDADAAIVAGVTTALAGKVDTTSVGANSGVASLDATGKVPSSQLPSYVDDVLEYDDVASFPVTGGTGKIYVAKDTNKTYRWGGTGYVEISESLALGETASTAYAGNKGKANADAIADIQGLIPASATTTNKLATAADVANKADKVTGAVSGNFAGLDANGNITDSGKKADDFLPSNTPIPSIENCYQSTDRAEETLANDDYFPFYDTSAMAKRKSAWSNIKSKILTFILNQLGAGLFNNNGYIASQLSNFSVTDSGTASASTIKEQVISYYENSPSEMVVHTEPIFGTQYMETTSYTTPSTGVRRFTFTNNVIRDSDDVDYSFSANVYGVNPTNVTIDTTGSTNVMMVDFNASDNVGKCRVYIRG